MGKVELIHGISDDSVLRTPGSENSRSFEQLLRLMERSLTVHNIHVHLATGA